jgi:hypothetical protein
MESTAVDGEAVGGFMMTMIMVLFVYRTAHARKKNNTFFDDM